MLLNNSLPLWLQESLARIRFVSGHTMPQPARPGQATETPKKESQHGELGRMLDKREQETREKKRVREREGPDQSKWLTLLTQQEEAEAASQAVRILRIVRWFTFFFFWFGILISKEIKTERWAWKRANEQRKTCPRDVFSNNQETVYYFRAKWAAPAPHLSTCSALSPSPSFTYFSLIPWARLCLRISILESSSSILCSSGSRSSPKSIWEECLLTVSGRRPKMEDETTQSIHNEPSMMIAASLNSFSSGLRHDRHDDESDRHHDRQEQSQHVMYPSLIGPEDRRREMISM